MVVHTQHGGLIDCHEALQVYSPELGKMKDPFDRTQSRQAAACRQWLHMESMPVQ